MYFGNLYQEPCTVAFGPIISLPSLNKIWGNQKSQFRHFENLETKQLLFKPQILSHEQAKNQFSGSQSEFDRKAVSKLAENTDLENIRVHHTAQLQVLFGKPSFLPFIIYSFAYSLITHWIVSAKQDTGTGVTATTKTNLHAREGQTVNQDPCVRAVWDTFLTVGLPSKAVKVIVPKDCLSCASKRTMTWKLQRESFYCHRDMFRI